MSWPLVKLEDISVVNPRLPKNVDELEQISFLRMASVSEEATILNIERKQLFEAKKGFTYFEKGDILLAKITPCFENGKAVFLDDLPTQIGFGSTEFHVIRVDSSIADAKYVFFMLWNDGFRFLAERNMTGSAGQKRVPANFLKGVKIPLPPLSIQKQIAAVLEKADNLRQQSQKMEQELNSLAQSVFLDMFGDPAKNEKGWPKCKLGDHIGYIGDIGSNGSNDTVSANLEMLDEENYALMVRTTNLNKNDFKDNVKFVTKKTYDFFKKSQIFGGEIIMNKIGSAGQFWIMPNLGRPVSLGLNQFVIRLTGLNTLYLYYYLLTDYGQRMIQSKLNGATTKSITKRAVKELPLMMPPLELQEKFADIIDRIQRMPRKNIGQELELNFNSLMQRAFKGELDLKDVA